MFLFPTPSQSSILYATVGQNFQLTVAAQAYHARYVWLKNTAAGCTKMKNMVITLLLVNACLSSALSWRISSFQVSGPANMNKTFTEGQNGKAQLSLSWIPQQRDAHRSTPICFTAETNQTWEPADSSGEVSDASDVPLKSDFCCSASRKWGVSLSWWPRPRTVKVSQPSLTCVPVKRE